MKKIFIFMLIICTGAMITSCSTVKYTGTGKGFSTNEEIASNISDINSAIEASKRDNFTVSEESKIETTDINGKPTSTYTSVRTGSTKTVFKNNSFDRKVKRQNGLFRVNTKFKGNTERE